MVRPTRWISLKLAEKSLPNAQGWGPKMTIPSPVGTARPAYIKAILSWIAKLVIQRGLRTLDDGLLSDLGLHAGDIQALRGGQKATPKPQVEGDLKWHA